jgi:hypothetical protein
MEDLPMTLRTLSIKAVLGLSIFSGCKSMPLECRPVQHFPEPLPASMQVPAEERTVPLLEVRIRAPLQEKGLRQ